MISAINGTQLFYSKRSSRNSVKQYNFMISAINFWLLINFFVNS